MHPVILQSVTTQVEPWIIIACGMIGVAWLNKRGQMGEAVRYLSEANKVLKLEVTEKDKQMLKLVAENEALKLKTDVSLALSPMMRELKDHDRRTNEMHSATMKILGLIAESLGPDDLYANSD